MGDDTERLVEERIRAAVPPGVRVYANVPILAKSRPQGPAHDAEADLVLLHPEHGLLVIETKGGEPSRDHEGRWYAGGRQLSRSPFKQAEDAKHDLVTAIAGLDGGPAKDDLRRGHAVAFPDADLKTLPRGHVLLGPEVGLDIVLDAEALASDRATAKALERAWHFWEGDGTRGRPLNAAQCSLIDRYLAPEVTIARLIHRDVADDLDRLVQASRAQLVVLNQNRKLRRVAVVGPAGSGKSLIAVEKARRLARDGWRTLYLCFNSPLASAVMREIAADDEAAGRRPTVSTFHGLCETLGRRAGTLQDKPKHPGQDWFDTELPAALDKAIAQLANERFNAIIVDEGQDFRLGWLESLQFLFGNPDDGVLWVFHDPGQALIRADEVDGLRLETLELFEDYRSPAPVASLAERFYRGPGQPVAMDTDGRRPVIEIAEPGRPTVEAVRRRLHELLVVNGVKPWDIVVLSGQAASGSGVWRHRQFGNVQLWNGAIDDAGRSLGLPAEQVPDLPADDGIVRFETARRFKGLESPVVVLAELPAEGARLDELLYTALTRATAHLIVIAPPALAGRLTGDAASDGVSAAPRQADRAEARRDPR